LGTLLVVVSLSLVFVGRRLTRLDTVQPA
jgi:hypothetical protein